MDFNAFELMFLLMIIFWYVSLAVGVVLLVLAFKFFKNLYLKIFLTVLALVILFPGFLGAYYFTEEMFFS